MNLRQYSFFIQAPVSSRTKPSIQIHPPGHGGFTRGHGAGCCNSLHVLGWHCPARQSIYFSLGFVHFWAKKYHKINLTIHLNWFGGNYGVEIILKRTTLVSGDAEAVFVSEMSLFTHASWWAQPNQRVASLRLIVNIFTILSQAGGRAWIPNFILPGTGNWCCKINIQLLILFSLQLSHRFIIYSGNLDFVAWLLVDTYDSPEQGYNVE